MALISYTEAQAYLKNTGAADQALIETFISRANQLLAKRCGWVESDSAGFTLESATYTLYADRTSHLDKRMVFLPVRPLGTVTSVHNDTTLTETYGSSELVPASDYTISANDGTLRLKNDASWGAWTEGYRAVKVITTAGYSTAPEWLKNAAGLTVRHLWLTRHTQGAQAQTMAGNSRTADQRDWFFRIGGRQLPSYLPEVGLG